MDGAARGDTLLAAARRRLYLVSLDRASIRPAPAEHGDTTYLCVVDRNGMAVSPIQSAASGFGSWLVEPRTGINLHNRGLGFSLVSFAGRLRGVLGTMGGDARPQILLQVLVALLSHRWSPGRSIAAPRWVLRGP